MEFFMKIVFAFAIFYCLTADINGQSHLFCQTDLTECKCDYYMGTLQMDCSEMGMQNMPNFLEDKVYMQWNLCTSTILITIFTCRFLGTNTQSRSVEQ